MAFTPDPTRDARWYALSPADRPRYEAWVAQGRPQRGSGGSFLTNLVGGALEAAPDRWGLSTGAAEEFSRASKIGAAAIGAYVLGTYAKAGYGYLSGEGFSVGSYTAGEGALTTIAGPGEQSTAIAALSEPSAAEISGSIDMPFGAEYAGAEAVESPWYSSLSKIGSPALTGAASATVSKLLTKAVDAVVNPLIAQITGQPAQGGGGGGGSSAGGYPFAMTGPQPSANTMQFYLVAAALAALLIVAMKKSRG